MRMLVRLFTSWLGKRVHPLRLGLELLGVLWALWPVGILCSVFLARLTYPMDLEWCEGGILYQAYRLVHGLPIYLRDDPVWTPWSYPPAHTAALALVGLLHLDFSSGRLVSIAFFGLMCVVLFRQIYLHLDRSSYGVMAGAFALAIVACAFPVVGQWYDLIRVDSMMMALSIIGIARTFRTGSNWRHTATTAAVLTAAVFTKQTAAFFVAWCCMFATIREPKRGIRLAATTGVFCLVVLGLLQWGTNGSYWFWTVTDLKDQAVEDARFVDGMRQIWTYAPFVFIVPLAALLSALRGSLSQRTILWTGGLVMAIPTSLLPYAKVGGYLNNLIPIVVLLAISSVLLVADMAKLGGHLGAVARWGTLLLLAAFVAARPLKYKEYVPNARDWQAAEELNALVASLDGGVVVPELAFLPARTGHTNSHWYTMAMWTAEWSGRPMNMLLALEGAKAKWVFLHSKDVDPFARLVRSRFKLAKRLPATARVRMLTGAAVVLDELWEKPRDVGAP